MRARTVAALFHVLIPFFARPAAPPCRPSRKHPAPGETTSAQRKIQPAGFIMLPPVRCVFFQPKRSSGKRKALSSTSRSCEGKPGGRACADRTDASLPSTPHRTWQHGKRRPRNGAQPQIDIHFRLGETRPFPANPIATPDYFRKNRNAFTFLVDG